MGGRARLGSLPVLTGTVLTGAVLTGTLGGGCARGPLAPAAAAPKAADPLAPVVVDGAAWDAVCPPDSTVPQLRPLAFGQAVFLCGHDLGRVVVLWPDGRLAALVDTGMADATPDGWRPLADVTRRPVVTDAAWSVADCPPDLAADAALQWRPRVDDAPWHRWETALVAWVRVGGTCRARVVASCPPPEPTPLAPLESARCGAATISLARQGADLVVVHEDNRGLARWRAEDDRPVE